MPTRPDAQGMRHAAGQFRSKGDRVATVVGRLEAQVAAMSFTGPAADEFRAAIDGEVGRLREVTRILGEAADVLNASAARVEADPIGFYSTGSGGV